MRAGLKPGTAFPGYQFPGHTGRPRRLPGIRRGDPMITVLGWPHQIPGPRS